MMEALSFGLNALAGISNGVIEEAKVGANNTISAANAYAQNLTRTVNNELRQSRANTARSVQATNNNRVLESTGSAVEVAGMNYRRARDSAVNDDFENQIAFAEQVGNQRAQSAFSGLQGGVADLVNATTRLRKNRLQARSDEALAMGDYDAGQRAKQIYQAGWDSLDSTEVSADIDYSVNTATKQQYNGSLLTEVLGKADVKNIANPSRGALTGYARFVCPYLLVRKLTTKSRVSL